MRVNTPIMISSAIFGCLEYLQKFCGSCTLLTVQVSILNDFVLPTLHFDGIGVGGKGPGEGAVAGRGRF